ncbi:MAG: valine--tRNA ligase [Candidatus Micrarchaeia archaeon]
MALEKLNCKELESKYVEFWADEKISEFDESDGKKKVYSVDTPPPFPTGEFHMGGTLNWGYIDFACRYKRMNGYNVLFPQGWDCHGFPTETKVEKKYGKGLPREEFREKCLEWTHNVVGSMKAQMIQLGFSIDWRTEYYTIDKEYHRKVQLSLLKMFEQKLVYRAKHPVLWCTYCGSAITKAETEDLQRETFLNYLKFHVVGAHHPDEIMLIATTRPELLHACVAVAVHPSDERYKALVGKTVRTPLYEKEVPIIADVDADPKFGTGAVMICTFGDKQDVVWAYRHSLPIIEACDGRGRLLDAGEFTGLDIREAREKILQKMSEKQLLDRQEKLQQTVKIHDRCKKTIEMMNSTQWFINVRDSKEEIKKAAMQMRWVPPHTLQLLEDWTDGLEWDWCISRQRVFGIPLPFWYCEKCGEVSLPKESALPVDPAKDAAPAAKCKCGGALVGEKGICDGWVDSSITPLVISGWPDNQKRFAKVYPASVRPQGTDIIRTWAFYTIFRCLKLTGKPPFQDMLVNGMVCGPDGKKMSKSLGNYVEAKDVIAKTSVDALRQWIALSGHTGKDNAFFWKDVDYAQSFLNKLWNASKFVEKSIEGYNPKTNPKGLKFRATDRWLLSRLEKLKKQCSAAMDEYDYYTTITAIYAFFWHDFCDYYIEDVKHRTYQPEKFGEEGKLAAQYCLREGLLCTVKLLAPFAPFVTEELYQRLGFASAEGKKSVHLAPWPVAEEAYINEQAENICCALHSLLSQVRKAKAARGMALNEELPQITVAASQSVLGRFPEIEEDLMATGKIASVALRPDDNIPDGEGVAEF